MQISILTQCSGLDPGSLTRFDLHQEGTGQLTDFDRSPSWLWVRKHGRINLIHGGIVTHVGEVNGGFEDVVQRATGFFQNDFDVLNDLGLQGISK